ncbi:MAG: hypothetical protein RQ732_10595 [Methylophaga sp.]|nr:hypothetical protein [Methylophaga sp.]
MMGDGFNPKTRKAARVALSAAFGLPIADDDKPMFYELAGDREPPSKRVRELWWLAGRRSEKTRTAAAVGLYLATVGAELEGLQSKLARGERGVVSIIAVDRAQAKLALNYLIGMIEASPMLTSMVERQDAESIDLTNRISISVSTNSFRAVRGKTLVATILDECAFYRSETTANPDVETYRAALPGLATTGGMMIGISSPYAKRGLLYQKYRSNYGVTSDDILVIKGASRLFNPTISEELVNTALAEDPEGAKSEWLAEFRSDISAFIDAQVLERAARSEPEILPPQRGISYAAFVDPSGGGNDGFSLAIGHKEQDKIIVDLVTERVRQNPAAVTKEYNDILRQYGINRVTGDKYAGQWPLTEFQRHGIRYDYSAKNRSELYIDSLSMFTSNQIELPPNQKLIRQFQNLERRTSRAGRDTIDHAPNLHDDLSNAVAGLSVVLNQKKTPVSGKDIRVRFAY